MSKKIYWKDMRQAITSSKGRFLSIFSLMGIGAIALVGLKVTSPNMERTAQAYIDSYNTMDLAVMSDYGLSDEDVAELNSIKKATVEYGYLTDVTIKNTNDAVRVFSNTKEVSQFKLVSGKMPTAANEIALASSMKGDYKVGDKISFTQSDNGTLKKTTFTVTGFVNSSEIWDEDTMGSSSAGYGELTGYAVTTKKAFDSEVYSIARISYDDLDDLAYYSDSYTDKLTKHKTALDKLLADNGENRLATLKADGQKEIDQGYADIAQSEQQLADAAQQLADGQSQIDSGQEQLAAAQAEVASNEATLAQAASQISYGQATLDASYQELVSAKAQLDAGKATLDSTKSQLDTAYSQLSTALSTLTATKAQLDTANSQLTAAKSELDSKKAQLDAVAAELSTAQTQLTQAQEALQTQKDSLSAVGQDPDSNADILAAQSQLDDQAQALSQNQATYEEGLAQYNTGLATYNEQLATYQAGLEQYNQGLATYNTNKTSYESGLAQYNAGLATYNTNLAAYEEGLAQYNTGAATLANSQAQYESGQAQLAEAKTTIAQNQAELNEAIAQLATSTADYNSQKAEAEQKIADAKADLADAQAELDALTEPTYTSYTRLTLPGGDGYETYDSATSSISAVGNIFPVVLYIVAAMVTLTTMTRFVDEERTNAGIFKALGYTKGQIIAKFVIYGLVASLLGTTVGILIGNFYLSPMIGNIISGTTVIGASNLYFYPSWTFLAIVLALISAVLPTYLVARRELSEEPAQLLLAKPPVSGSKIFLERLSFIWKRLSFTHKVTARNIFRYKQRMLMTIFGVAGSVALLFAGLGIQSSISGVGTTQFGDILRYDMIVAENSGASQSEAQAVSDLIASSKVKSHLSVQYSSTDQDISGVSEKQAVTFLVSDSSNISNFVHLRDRSSGDSLKLSNSGAIISEKLAKLYNAEVGDTISMTLNDKTVKVKISGITEMYAGHFVFMTADYYEKITDDSYAANANLLTLKDTSSSNIQKVSADFIKLAGVSGVVQNTALIKQVNTVSGSLNSVMIILVVLSVLLAVVILYNLTNINVAERIRELSTIKVLGFHNKEVTMYIYRETIVLSLIGIVTGLAGGLLLHQVILNMIGSESIMFNPSVALYVYLVPILAIVLILTILGWFVNHTLRKVDMLEALKSVE